MNIKIVSAGKTEIFNFAMPIGVGLIESAINLTKLCEFDRPDYLIFIGSAGSYGKLNIFDIIESKTASNIENCFFKKECYTPIDNIISLENVSHETKIVNSSNYITTNPSLAKAYLKLNIQAENMEFFSVLKVAKLLRKMLNKKGYKVYMTREADKFIKLRNRTRFAKDGAGENFENQKIKLIFIGKETNDTGETFDWRDYLNEGVFYRKTNKPFETSYNLYRWAKFLLDGEMDFSKYSKIERDKNKRVDIFSRVAFMNIKKETGGSSANCDTIIETGIKDKEYLKQQLSA